MSGICFFSVLVVAAKAVTPSLRELAGNRLFIGGAVNYGYAAGTCASCSDPVDTANYTNLLKDFSVITPENCLKMPTTFVAKDQWNFTKGDFVVKLAKEQGVTAIRGHNLVWVAHNPAWLSRAAAGMTPAELEETMATHIKATAGHFKDQVYSWDVVNEAINNVPHLRRCPLPQWNCSLKTKANGGSMVDWTRAGTDGVTYVEKAFQYAHAADPNAKLFFNEFDIHGENDKMAVVEAMLSDLKGKGVPVHGVGLQTHIDNTKPGKAFNETGFRNVLSRFAKLGLEIHITEMNIKSASDPMFKNCTTEAEKEEALANLFGAALSACQDQPLCKSFELWGITDHHNSMNTYGGKMPVPGSFLYDDYYQPKLARARVAEILKAQSSKSVYV